MRLQTNESRDCLLTELMLATPSDGVPTGRTAAPLDGIVIGVLRDFEECGVPRVDFTDNPSGEPLPAQTTTALTEADLGRDVALMFEKGDPHKPIILGLIQDPRARTVKTTNDADCLMLTAKGYIEFRCGKASITLTKSGKIILRGEYLLSRSSGVNCIKGGSVQIN